MAKEISSAVAHLHVHEVCHKDLKPNNILLTSAGHIQGSSTSHSFSLV